MGLFNDTLVELKEKIVPRPDGSEPQPHENFVQKATTTKGIFKNSNDSFPKPIGNFGYKRLEDPQLWKTQHYLRYGRCFTIRVPTWLRELKVISQIIFYFM